MLHFTKDHLETASIEMDKYFLSEVVTKYTKEEEKTSNSNRSSNSSILSNFKIFMTYFRSVVSVVWTVVLQYLNLCI